MSEPFEQTAAVVLSGGGAKGAYEVGVMKALFDGASPATGYKPLSPEIFTGTSVGALNATFLASQADVTPVVAMTRLEVLWREKIANSIERCGNGVFRVRGLPLQGFELGCLRHPLNDITDLAKDSAFFTSYFIRRGSNLLFGQAALRTRIAETVDLTALISRQPLDELVRQVIDIESLRASPKKLTIVTTNWKNGSVRFITKEEIVEKYGAEAVLASSAIPGIFNPVLLDGVPFADGGLVNNTPFRPAIRYGANVLHIIYVDPLVAEIGLPEFSNTLDTSYRVYAIALADRVNNDLINLRSINEFLRLIDQPERARTRTAQQVTRIARIVRPHRQQERGYRRIEAHRYRPTDDLGGAAGLLDFRADNIERLTRLGYEDAVNHDCKKAGCELPLPTGEKGEAQ